MMSDNKPKTLGQFYTSGFNPQNSRTLLVLSFSASFCLAFLVGSHHTMMADVRSSAQDVTKSSVDDEATQK